MTNREILPLGETVRDIHVEWAKGVVNLFPGIGPILSTVIGISIPNQRLGRIEDFLRKLDRDIRKLHLEESAQTPHGSGLIEDGVRLAASAISDVRRQHIKNLVVKGLNSTEIGFRSSRQFLKLLDQLEDDDLALLLDIHENPRNPLDGTAKLPSYKEPTADQLLSEGIRTVQENRIASYGLITKAVGQIWKISPAGVEFLKFLNLTHQGNRTM